MPAKEVEKQYNDLRNRYNLPEFKEMDLEFELSDLEETSYLLRCIIRLITDKLYFYSHLIEELINPEVSNLYAIHEMRCFDETEKNNIYELYKRLMEISRHSIIIALGSNEKEEAEFINNFFYQWIELKKELLKYVKKMRNSWSIPTDVKEDLGYLG